MAEVIYAKQFLSLLDARAIKLSSDYVANPRTLPGQPAYILPRRAKPLSKRSQPTSSSTPTPTPSTSTSTSTPSNTATLTITLKPLRSPSSPIALSNITPDTSIYDLKTLCAAQTGYLPEKVKVLWERKPVADSKTVGEIVGEKAGSEGGEGEVEVEMGVMFVGAPTEEVKVLGSREEKKGTLKAGRKEEEGGEEKEKEEEKEKGKQGKELAQGFTGEEVVASQGFWDDLSGFVLARVRNEEVAKELLEGFRESWKARAGK